MLTYTKKVKLTCTFILLIITTIGNRAFTQNTCGTKTTAQQVNYINKHIRPLSQNGSKLRTSGAMAYIPVKAHILRKNDGSGGLEVSNLIVAIDKMNEYYKNAYIQFYLYESINYINSSTYYNKFEKGSDHFLGPTYDVANVINIYFTNLITDGDDTPCGYTYFPGDHIDRVVMKNSCTTNGSTLSHELGHYFSLYHTHETYEGKELVDGSNCSTTGDQLCDTPADPGLSDQVVNSGCIYKGNSKDDNGEAYHPDVHNMMSYSLSNCRNKFSQGQYARMAVTVESERNYLHIKDTPAPSIASFSPANAAGGTQITITGTGFSPVANENVVMFGDLPARVVAGSGTQLTVIVPHGVKHEKITAVTNQQMTISHQYFWESVVSTYPYAEGFESDLGHWQQSSEDDIDWVTKSGAGSASGTDLDGAAEGLKYLYTEVSGSSLPNDNSDTYKTAVLTSKSFNLLALPNPRFSFRNW